MLGETPPFYTLVAVARIVPGCSVLVNRSVRGIGAAACVKPRTEAGKNPYTMLYRAVFPRSKRDIFPLKPGLSVQYLYTCLHAAFGRLFSKIGSFHGPLKHLK